MKKRILAGLIAAVMVFTTAVVPMTQVFAEEIVESEESDSVEAVSDEEAVEETIPADDAEADVIVDEEPAEEVPAETDVVITEGEYLDLEEETEVVTEGIKETFEFLYIDQAELAAPGTQYVAISIADTTRQLTEATLVYRLSTSEAEYTVPAETVVDNAALFVIAHDESEIGATVTLRDVLYSYEVDDAEGEQDIIAPITEDLMASYTIVEQNTEESGMTVYTVDEDGNEIETDSIEEALEEAGDAEADSQSDASEDETKTISGMSRSVNEAGLSNTAKSPSAKNWNTNSPGIVVAIDPGHDATHAGATANGLKEEVVNLQLALAMRDELEQYDDVTVIMTRTTAACPNPGGSAATDNAARVSKAYAAGADIYIALHMNSTTNTSANGALVISQNSSWKPDVTKASVDYGNEVLSQLSKLGLKNIGVSSRNTTVGETYPDGSTSDYHTITIKCKEYGIPGLFVEHGFLTNASDASKFKDAAFVKKAGIADATAVANYYGLTKSSSSDSQTLRADSITMSVNEFTGQVTLKAENIKPSSKVSSVQFAFWMKGETPTSANYHTATLNQDNSYTYTLSLKDYNGFQTGKYYLDCYVTDTSGKKTSIGGTSQTLTNPGLSVTATKQTNATISVKATMTTVPSSLSSMQIAVWSTSNMSDLEYITMSGTGSTRTATIDLTKHKQYGTYYIDTYAVLTNGTKSYAATRKVAIAKPTGTVSVQNNNSTNGSYDVVISGITADTGISSIQVATWNQSSDLKYVTPTKQSDGSYKVHISYTDHQNRTGKYYNDVYIKDAFGTNVYIGGKSTTVSTTGGSTSVKPTLSASLTSGTTYQLTLSNATVPSGGSVTVAVWSSSDNLKWYTASKNSSGQYVVSVNANDHGKTGKHYADAYVQTSAGTKTHAAGTTFTPADTSATTPTLKAALTSGTTYQLTLSGQTVPSGSLVTIAVWSSSSDLKWYTASKNSSGQYVVSVDAANHGTSGKHYADAYVQNGSGVKTYSAGTTFTASAKPSVVVSSVSGNATKRLLTLNGAKPDNGGTIVFAVWKDTSDLKWYTASADSRGSYSYTMDLTNHGKYGKYYVDCYKQSSSGTRTHLAGTSFTVGNPSATLSVNTVNAGDKKATVRLTNLSAPLGYSKVRAATWAQNGTAKWTDVTISGNSGTITIDSSSLGYTTGKYYCDVYLVDKGGTSIYLGGKSVTLTADLYPIMGTSTVSVSQMTATYVSHGKDSNLGTTLSRGGASTIYAFCKIIDEEAKKEGVRSEVVFAQVMLETGWLNFGGDVKVGQFNFAGLGVTGNGVPGLSFPDVRTGIRAQVQHLKAYGSTEALNYACVDPRFSYVTRGSAIYVDWLGIQENPNHLGWAASAGYGANLRKIINECKAK